MNLNEFRQAQQLAVSCGQPVLTVLAEQSRLSPLEALQQAAALFNYRALPVDKLYASPPAFELLPLASALQHQCLALHDESGQLLLATGDPWRPGFLAWADACLNQPFLVGLALPGDIVAVLAKLGDRMQAMDTMTAPAIDADEGSPKGGIEELTISSIQADASPIVRLTNSTLYDAYKAGASDIHLETTANGMRIKYRIDGVLTLASEVKSLATAEQVISRIKIMAELDIAERRVPQDGRIKIAINGRGVDLRVSVMPSIFGEDGVLRILDKHSLTEQLETLTLESLGFDDATIRKTQRLAREPYGMLLVTGPTGSGKTTTLYAAIGEINDGQSKIITIEDPVEYQLPDVLQIPVNERKGLTFARGLRSILRHDPDKIMVGEIRDDETAQIAVQSALTGHLVLTTVHANNVFDVISRFIHMGIAPHSFVSALNGILAQRLVRINCAQCSVDDLPDMALIQESGLDASEVADYRFRKGRGCANCRGTGFKGRKAIGELLHLNDRLREQIISGAPVSQMRETAAAGGTRFLREAALDMVRAGQTTLQEINRVTFVA